MGSQEFDSQQTRLSGFFRSVHLKFSGLVKKELKVDAPPEVVRKKPLLVIGDFGDNVASEDPICAPEIQSVSEVDSKDGIAIIQVAQTGSILAKAGSEATVAEVKQANAGAGTKRKATEYEDVITKRIDTRICEAPFPSTKSAIRKEPEETTTTNSCNEFSKRVKRVTWEQDSDWIHEPPAPESPKVAEPAKDVNVQQDLNSVQAPPCNEFSNSADANDSEKCTTSGRRMRKDMFLGETWGLPVDSKGDLFCSKLKEILCKPFDANESSEMWNLVTRRKPVLKLRQTRGRTMHVPSKSEGLSYLDHHPDLARRIRESSHPAEKLALLRAFFFWLQHSCMEGAFKPWAPETKSSTPEGDCVLTDGPDCEVLAVVLPLDEKNEVSTVVKPLEPVLIDLSDDDDDDCCEVTVKPPVKTAPKTDVSKKLQQQVACVCCNKEFGMEKERQRALYRSCGHIETCMQCVERLWKLEKHACLKCGAIQSTKPGSLFEFVEA